MLSTYSIYISGSNTCRCSEDLPEALDIPVVFSFFPAKLKPDISNYVMIRIN